ncbi:MAG TPA: hypothetical protein VJH05_00125, partial [Candidatus Paceibacterota bacterium]
CLWIEEAVQPPEVVEKIHLVLIEVGQWLGFNKIVAQTKARVIIKRFSSPLQDPINRILGQKDRQLGNPYIDIPLRELSKLFVSAPTLKEAQKLYSNLA